MSMIFKTTTQEVEIGPTEARIARALGMEADLGKDEVIDVLNHVTVRLAAKGDTERYRKVTDVIAELDAWGEDTLTIEF